MDYDILSAYDKINEISHDIPHLYLEKSLWGYIVPCD